MEPGEKISSMPMNPTGMAGAPLVPSVSETEIDLVISELRYLVFEQLIPCFTTFAKMKEDSVKELATTYWDRALGFFGSQEDLVKQIQDKSAEKADKVQHIKYAIGQVFSATFKLPIVIPGLTSAPFEPFTFARAAEVGLSKEFHDSIRMVNRMIKLKVFEFNEKCDMWIVNGKMAKKYNVNKDEDLMKALNLLNQGHAYVSDCRNPVKPGTELEKLWNFCKKVIQFADPNNRLDSVEHSIKPLLKKEIDGFEKIRDLAIKKAKDLVSKGKGTAEEKEKGLKKLTDKIVENHKKKVSEFIKGTEEYALWEKILKICYRSGDEWFDLGDEIKDLFTPPKVDSSEEPKKKEGDSKDPLTPEERRLALAVWALENWLLLDHKRVTAGIALFTAGVRLAPSSAIATTILHFEIIKEVLGLDTKIIDEEIEWLKERRPEEIERQINELKTAFEKSTEEQRAQYKKEYEDLCKESNKFAEKARNKDLPEGQRDEARQQRRVIEEKIDELYPLFKKENLEFRTNYLNNKKISYTNEQIRFLEIEKDPAHLKMKNKFFHEALTRTIDQFTPMILKVLKLKKLYKEVFDPQKKKVNVVGLEKSTFKILEMVADKLEQFELDQIRQRYVKMYQQNETNKVDTQFMSSLFAGNV